MVTEANLISVESTNLNGELTQTVNARDLHARLEVKQDFSNWVKYQIERAGLDEGADYVFAKIGENSVGRPTNEYHLTVDAAKHIAMMSNTPRGKEIRKYFIEVEKGYKTLLIAREKEQALLDAEPRLLKQVEADYKENLKHHPNYELGTTLKNAIRCQDYGSTVELDKILDELDFAPAAKAQGASVASIRRQVAARISATHLLNSLHMGQHEHEDPVRNVIQWAATLVREEDARAKMLAYQKERDKPKLTYQDLLAQEMASKHTALVTATPKKRVARKPK